MTGDIKGHKDLVVWREAMALVKLTYILTGEFPKAEQYGLVSQMRRAAVSIPSNIAEGAGRGGSREFYHFLTIARGSLSELETQVLLAYELEFMPQNDQLDDVIGRIFRMIGGLQRKLRDK